MADQNSVFQIIVEQPGGTAYSHMCAGSGWFINPIENDVPEGTMLTNAHVVRNAKDIFIRLPAAHNTDIRAHVRGMSSDLDIAVLEFAPEQLNVVKQILKDRYGSEEIPTLSLADSDKVHPTSFKKPERPAVYARGYPLGTEYQMTTNGIVSGLKHTRNQVYLVTTATINSGNSGGPAVNENGDVIGINSMKLVSKGVEEINMIIPSNRIKRMLPQLMDNHEIVDAVHQALAQILFQKQLMKLGKEMATIKQQKEVAHLMSDLDEVSYKTVVSNWNQHNVGGFKRGKDGVVTPVTISDWYMKHVHNKAASHALFSKVFKHLHNNQIEEVQKMRKTGFKEYYCQDMGCGKDHKKKSMMDNVIMPPRMVHMPKLGFEYSNGTGEAMLKYYNAPPHIKSGIIISSLYSCSNVRCSGFVVGDLLWDIDGKSVSNFGEVWCGLSQTSQSVIDVLSRVIDGVNVGVLDVGGVERVRVFKPQPTQAEIRFTDNILDAAMLSTQVTNLRGLTLKVLRMDDVMRYQLQHYLGDQHAHKFRIVVADINTQSPAYHAKSIRPGSILASIDDKPIPNTWEAFTEMLTQLDNDKPTKLITESNKILII